MARPRVLVVEDEWLIAAEMEEVLRMAGYDVVGPAQSVARALAALADGPVDAAVLDIQLHSELSFPVA